MSNYTDNLESTEMVSVPEFYLFQSGSTVERYTSYPSTLSFLGNNYIAATIKRGKLVKDTKFGVTKLNLTAPLTESMAKYIPNQPIEPMTITIYRSVIDDLTSYVIFFKGRVTNIQIRDKTVAAIVESKNRILLKKVPSIIYQSFCNHTVFDDGCALDEFAWKRKARVTGISTDGYTITYAFTDGGGTPAADYFRGGKAMLGTDLRLIVDNTDTDKITLQIPFDSRLTVGSEFDFYPGCDGDPSTCLNKFNNLTNLLAMPYIPSTNPVLWGFK